jgi:hypothetical protein
MLVAGMRRKSSARSASETLSAVPVVTEIECGKVAMQMRFAAMLATADRAALEHSKNAARGDAT